MSYRVAVVKWARDDGIAEAFQRELVRLGHRPVSFQSDAAIPRGTDVVLSFAPWGRFLPIARQLAPMPASERPTLVHWNTEALPDLRLPWAVMGPLGWLRSWVDRLSDSPRPHVRRLAGRLPLSWANARLHKFRYLGDYRHAYRQGWLALLAEFSTLYARLHRRHGLPAIFVPWGAAPDWYADLRLERDIDVLWLGVRRSRRRSQALDWVRAQLAAHGVQMHVVDGVEHPYVFGEERTRLLNRSRITLNLLPTWYDNNLSFRLPLVAGNRSLIVSEPVLAHCPHYVAGTHYVAAPLARLPEAILYYLQHEGERRQIAENAWRLMTRELTMGHSIEILMNAVCEHRRRAGQAAARR